MEILHTDITEAEEKKFQDFYTLENDSDLEIEDKLDMYDQYFTTPEEAKAYNNWRRAKKAKEPKASDDSAAISDAEPDKHEPYNLDVYQKQLQNADFTNVDKVAILNGLLNSGFHPHIPIGHTKGKAFHLVPNTRILRPTKENSWKHAPDVSVLPPMILGINHDVRLNVPIDYGKEEQDAITRYLDDPDPHSSDDESDSELTPWQLHMKLARKVAKFSTPGRPYGKYGQPELETPSSQTASEVPPDPSDLWKNAVVPRDDIGPASDTNRRFQMRSNQSGDSTTMNDGTGFAFYQLGTLHCCNTLADPTTADAQEIFAKERWSTDYVLVAKTDTSRHLKDIWILFDLWADREDPEPVRALPGKFPGTNDYITAAKIADGFADLRANREIRFSDAQGERFEEDYELVGCFRTADRRIVRQWVVGASA